MNEEIIELQEKYDQCKEQAEEQIEQLNQVGFRFIYVYFNLNGVYLVFNQEMSELQRQLRELQEEAEERKNKLEMLEMENVEVRREIENITAEAEAAKEGFKE